MGTMGLPSIPGTGCLCFLPQRLAAFDAAGANKPPVTAPSTERNERRLHSNFTSSFLSTWRRGRIDDHRATYDFNRRIARNPFDAMHAFEKTRYPRHGRAQKPNWQPLAWFTAASPDTAQSRESPSLFCRSKLSP